jgi:hypothetical protein
MRLRSLSFAFAVIIVSLAAACGGGGSGGGGGGSDEDQAGAAANRHIKTILGLFDGSTSGAELLNVFAPECRKDVKASDLDAMTRILRAFAPDLSKNKIDQVDMGKLDFKTTSDGILVNARDSNSIRVKTNGKWLSADEYFQLVGLDSTEDSPVGGDPTLMVKRDGKWYIGDCTALQDFSGF